MPARGSSSGGPPLERIERRKGQIVQLEPLLTRQAGRAERASGHNQAVRSRLFECALNSEANILDHFGRDSIRGCLLQ